MPENKQPNVQTSGCSPELLLLRSYNILLEVSTIEITANEIQAFGALLESLGGAITLYGNMFGVVGFDLETLATKIHISAVRQELEKHNGESKLVKVHELLGYQVLLMGGELGIISNEYQALGALIQSIAGVVTAFGNSIAISGLNYQDEATRLQIASVIKQLREQKSDSQSSKSSENGLSTQLMKENESSGFQFRELYQEIQHLKSTINQYEIEIREIHKTLNDLKRSI